MRLRFLAFAFAVVAALHPSSGYGMERGAMDQLLMLARTRPNVNTQFADKVKDGPVEIFGDVGPNAQYFDVSAYRPVTEIRFGNSGHGGQTKTLQFRAGVFNVSNTPHFSNPNTNMSKVVFNADGSIRSLNGVGGITGTDRTGRQYDERSGAWG